MNRILAAIEPSDYDALMAEAKVITLKLEKQLYGQDERVDTVYFPLTCMVSVLAGPDGGDLTEAATIGREGIAGAESLILNQTAIGLHVIQLPGTGVLIAAEVFRKHLGAMPRLKDLVDRHLFCIDAADSSGCRL